MKPIIIVADGCVKGKVKKGERAINHSACGFIVVDGNDNTVIANQAKYLGKRTISEAEYYGLIDGLMYLTENGYTNHDVKFCMDSEFIVKQMNGKYRCHAENILPLFKRAQELSRNFSKLRIVHHSRETQLAKAVDRLVTKQCLESIKRMSYADTESQKKMRKRKILFLAVCLMML